MNVSIVQNGYLLQTESFTQPEERNLLVVNALRFVIENVFANYTNAVATILSTAAGPADFWIQGVLNKLFASLNFMSLIILKQEKKSLILHEKISCNLIFTDSLESLEKTNIAEYNNTEDSLNYYLIFLPEYDGEKRKEMERIFQFCFYNFWLHCNIMIQNSNGEVLVYTYFPFKDRHCFQTKPEMINKFTGGRFENNIIYPDKLKNLNKCPLKLTTWIVPPFVINRTGDLFPDTKFSGFEMIIMLTISRSMNFSLDINLISIDTYHQNQTPATLPLKMLTNLETNITMGYFRRTATRDQVVSSTYVTYYLPIVAVILRKQSKYESLGIFTFPFDSTTWGLLIFLYSIIIILNNLNTKRGKVNNFQTYEILMGISVYNVPKESKKRITFMTVLLSSFFLRSVYQSLLFYLFRTNFYKAPPVSLQCLVADDYKVVSTEMSLHFIGNIPQIHDGSLPLKIIYSPNELCPLNYLVLNENHNYAALSVADFAFYYANLLLSKNHMLQVLPVNVNDQQICFYLTKNSYLVERLNWYILWFQQAGLLLKWKEWSNFEYQVQKKMSSPTAYETVLIVNLNQLVGFFFVMIFLYSIAFVLFCLELLSKKLKVFKYFKYFFKV